MKNSIFNSIKGMYGFNPDIKLNIIDIVTDWYNNITKRRIKMKIYHTKTQEEYNYLMQQLESKGFKWSNGEFPLELNYWDIYKKETCIKEDEGELTYSDAFFYKEQHPHIEIQSVVIPDNKGDGKWVNLLS